ncbi:uncharacterized protein LOC142227387 [Haematobia irritans]|uniref:uncharacterized protein LOC142227387 n=1 Tax=Haematobia irritans TaxID=7368 RepID=UPI003F5037A2
MQSKLIEIPFEKWTHLRDLYKKHKDRASCFYTIQTFIDWYRKDPNVQLKIYTPSNEWEIDGTYIADLAPANHLYCNTLRDDISILVSGLKYFDNTKIVAGFQERILSAVEQFFMDSGLTKTEFISIGTVWHHISREDALKFDIGLPENITAKDLDECHAEQVDSVWPHRSDESVVQVRHLIKFNKSIGLFEGDELVAWCLLVPLGSLGLLQVEESHKRKGYGKLVTKLMSKYLAENGVEVMAAVVFENVASRSMFKQLGFKIIDNVYWSFKL